MICDHCAAVWGWAGIGGGCGKDGKGAFGGPQDGTPVQPGPEIVVEGAALINWILKMVD